MPIAIDENQATEAQPHPPIELQHAPKIKPLISSEKFAELYSRMSRLRALHRIFPPVTLPRGIRGLEACEAACTVDLRTTDVLAVATDSAAVEVLHHESAAEIVERLAQAKASRKPQPDRVADGILAVSDGVERVRLATGLASALRLRREGDIVVVFASAREMAKCAATLSFAHATALPILYVQIGASAEGSAGRAGRTPKDSIATMTVDANDPVALYRVAFEATDKARRGVGPTLIPCIPFQTGKSTRGQSEAMGSPASYLESYLRSKQLWSESLRQDAEAFAHELDSVWKARKKAKR